MTLIPLPAAAVTLNLPTIVVRQLVRQDALTGYRIGGVLKVDDGDLAGVRDVEVEQARAIVEGRAERDRLRRERPEIVAWLRKWANGLMYLDPTDYPNVEDYIAEAQKRNEAAVTGRGLADLIERGEHLS